ncbi:MAG: phage portal protein [Sphaerobacter sp.]|nr:phage portal protein [Sphaerobacter sp.]
MITTSLLDSLRAVLGIGDRRSLENPQEPITPQALAVLVEGARSSSGLAVNEESALRVAAVYSAVRVLAETLAMLPLHVYRRLARGKDRASEHPLYPLLHDQPNPEMTSFVFRETLMGHLALWGNAYAQIVYDGAGRVAELWPLRPDWMDVDRDASGRLRYVYRTPAGARTFAPSEVLHIPALSFDGLKGKPPLAVAREAIGLALATQEYGARFFANDARPGIVLKHPGTLSDKARANLLESWNRMHQGLRGAHRAAVLEEGMDIATVGIPPEDAQFLESRRFQVTEIARIFRVPPHLIGDLDRATYSNIEQQSLEFVQYTMLPWLRRWEQAINAKLFTEQERRDGYFVEFQVEGLLRGDTKSRYEAYAVGRQNGWLSANDIRELENLNPIEGGDVYLVPLNMVPASAVGSEPSQPQGGKPGAPPTTARALETRDKPGAKRRRDTEAFQRLYQDVEERVVRRESHKIREAMDRYLGRRDAQGFRQWLDGFYDREHRAYIEQAYRAPNAALAAAIYADALDEIHVVGAEGMTPDAERWLADYTASHAQMRSGWAKAQIVRAIDRAQQAATDPAEEIQAVLDRWQESRPSLVAQRETVQLANAVAMVAWAAHGITKLRWSTTDAESCPYCTHLDGRVVGIEQPFIGAGQELQVEGISEPLKVDVNVHHPPAHDGCKCIILPEV